MLVFTTSAPGFTSKRGYCDGHDLLAGSGISLERCAATCRGMNVYKICMAFIYFHAGGAKDVADCLIKDRPCTNPIPWPNKDVIVYAYSKTGKRLIVDTSP